MAGTGIAYELSGGRRMVRIARVSAVFLLALGLLMTSVTWGKTRSKGGSVRETLSSNEAGVGTTQIAGDKVAPKRHDRARAERIEPQVIFRAVATGLRSGRPEAFVGYFGKGRVRLDFGEGGPRGGLFTKSQAYYLLSQYLKRAQTMSTRFIRSPQVSTGHGHPSTLLERLCRYRSGVVSKQLIFVSLSLEDNRWVISEMRIIPAQ